ncbi:MAG: LapA family protein [Magnetococcales bacterium]|nr:LapA family protein [Magnetococcales bacterium]
MVTKPFVSLILSILLLIFASQNMNTVQIRFIVGPTIEMPLILIISGAFICGFVLATFNQLARKTLRNRRRNEGL